MRCSYCCFGNFAKGFYFANSKVQEIVCSTFYRRHREDTAVQDNGGSEECAFLPIAVCLPLLLYCLNSPTHQAIYITYTLYLTPTPCEARATQYDPCLRFSVLANFPPIAVCTAWTRLDLNSPTRDYTPSLPARSVIYLFEICCYGKFYSYVQPLYLQQLKLDNVQLCKTQIERCNV